MPSVNVKIGDHNLIINYQPGDDGFIEINHQDREMSLHIRQEDDMLLALNFVEGAEDPACQLDLLTGDVYLD